MPKTTKGFEYYRLTESSSWFVKSSRAKIGTGVSLAEDLGWCCFAFFHQQKFKRNKGPIPKIWSFCQKCRWQVTAKHTHTCILYYVALISNRP